MVDQCPEIGDIQAYIDKELSRDENLKIEKHLLGCVQCRQIAAEIVHEDEWLTGLLLCENRVLNLNTNRLSKWFNEELGIKFWWVLSGFLLLGLIAVLSGTNSLREIAVSWGIQGYNPHLLIDACRQKLVSDGWRLIITWGVSRSTGLSMIPTGWLLFLLVMGLAFIRLLSTRLSRIKELVL